MDEQEIITEKGNPGRPDGEDGAAMLDRMNTSHRDVTEWGLGFADIRADADVLDIGCGGGAALARLAGMAPEGFIRGIDYSDVSVKKSGDFNADLIKAGRMEVVHGSVAAMPYGDESFDLITTVESFYFWPDPSENLKEVFRVLRSGGIFLLIADIYGDAELSGHERENVKKYNLFNPTAAEFKRLFEGAGFKSAEIHLKDGTNWICAEGRK